MTIAAHGVNSRRVQRFWAGAMARLAGLVLVISSGAIFAEGSRTLYPSTYPAAGFRGELDLTGAVNKYAGVTARRQFVYVYANAGEYILLGSSNRSTNTNADIFVYNPQSFGTKGNETIPAAANFSCSGTAPAIPAGSFGGTGTGFIASRTNELAGPNSADNSQTVINGYAPCAYLAPTTGIYGVLFTTAIAGGGGATGSLATWHLGSATVWAWEAQVRANATSLVDINGRTFTYGFVAFTGANSRPVFHTLYYVTPDGARYQQDMKGFDPNGYALWGNQYGYFDNAQPLYKDLRGNDALVNAGYPAELSAQGALAPIFLSDVSPSGANSAQVATVLTALGIPLSPPSPQVSGITFNGLQSGNQTYVGGGGTFTFTAANDTTYQIVISAGVDFDPANPANATLTGLAPNGSDSVLWSGLANNGSAFPPGTFNFQITGRNGEIHFPIIDDEGSANGGPVLTKLNGTPSGDHTVYYDDRGYTTGGGVNIGTPGGLLCPANPPVPPTPDHSLIGQDSSAQTFSGPNCNGGTGTCFYRYWPGNGNANTDCAATAGFGDAKALDLWAFQSTPVQSSTVVINPSNLTLAKSAPASVALNTPFNYTIGIGNNSGAASGTTATVSDILPTGVIANSVAVGSGVSAVNCGTLPSAPGATLTCSATLSAPLPGGSANGTAQFTINATATAYGVATNYASVDPSGGGSPPAPGGTCTPVASCGSASTTVIAPPTIAKTFGSASIPLNGSTSLSFTIINPNSGSSLSGIGVTDGLPAGLVVATPNGLTGSCGGGTITATSGGNSVSLSGATLAANASCVFSVNVAGIAAGAQNNTTGNVTSTEGGNGNTASASTSVVAPPSIAKAFSPTTIAVNGTTSLTFTITNPSANTVALTGVAFTDTLPAGLTVANASTTFCGGTLTTTAPTGIALSGATIPATGQCQFSVTVTGATAGSYTNITGNVSSSNGGTGNTATANVSVVAVPTVVKAFSPTTIAANGTSTLTITLSNANATALTGTAFTDTLPGGVTTVAASAATTCTPGTAGQTAGTVTLTGATIPANGSCDVTVTVTSATAGSYTNTIPAGGVTTTNGGSNTTPTSATLTVNTVANLTLSKAGPATVTAGGSVVYTLGLGNSGGTLSGTSASVTDVLPVGVVANSVAVGSGVSAVSCGTLPSAAGATLTCTLTLTAGISAGAANGAAVFTLTTTAPGTGGSITNYASVDPTGGGSPPPPGAGCTPATSCGSATTTVLAPVLQIVKTGPATATAGGNIAYTIQVTNSGTADATNAILADPAPADLTFVSAGSPCAGGFPCNLGTVAIGQSITIPAVTFSIASSVTGTITNTATVTSDQTTQTSSSASTTVAAPALIVPTPVDARLMLLTMLTLLGLVGAVRIRARG